MPFNGTGTFTRLYNWTADALAGLGISQVKFDADGNDVAGALSNCLTRDGQGQPTADIPWNNHKITTLANPVNPQDAVNLQTAQSFAPDGNCYFQYTNGTTCTLMPINGGGLYINGALQLVPSGGVTLSSTGGVSGGGNVAASTLYYVYAYMNSATPSVMALEASTTGWTLDGTGRKNKTGDTTRRLVGMVFPAAGSPGVFTDASPYNGVASYFNRKSKGLSTSVSTSSQSTSPTLLSSPALITLNWVNGDVSVCNSGLMYNLTASTTTYLDLYQDGVSQATVAGSCTVSSQQFPCSASFDYVPAEGAHSWAVYGQVSAGTGNWGFLFTVLTRN